MARGHVLLFFLRKTERKFSFSRKLTTVEFLHIFAFSFQLQRRGGGDLSLLDGCSKYSKQKEELFGIFSGKLSCSGSHKGIAKTAYPLPSLHYPECCREYLFTGEPCSLKGKSHDMRYIVDLIRYLCTLYTGASH